MNNVANGPPLLKSADLARAIRLGDISAREATEAAIARVEATDSAVNAFTGKSYQRARQEAAAVDGASANVEPLERTGRCAAAGGLSVITASVG